MKSQRYGVANALMYLMYTVGVVALSRFYFISLYVFRYNIAI
ncbi:formate dehydrogenase [Kingella kingae]|nr:formate dehydrogenase [Kingella kingae]